MSHIQKQVDNIIKKAQQEVQEISVKVRPQTSVDELVEKAKENK